MAQADHNQPSSGVRAAITSTVNEQEVFAYLDANPDALRRYLRGERSPINTGFTPIPPTAASENEVQFPFDALAFVDDPLVGFGDNAGQSTVEREQAAHCWELLDSYLAGEVAGDNEVEAQAGPEAPSVEHTSLLVQEEEVAVAEEVSPQAGPEEPSEDNDATSEGVEQAASEGETAGAADTTPVDNGAGAVNDDDNKSGFITYPAPANLVAASRQAAPTRSWALWEEEACIRHMLDINNEAQIRGEARFHEAMRRMRAIDGCTRDKPNAVKNFWNRVGRARSALDERRNKKAPLATSQQCKKTRNNKGTKATSSSSSSLKQFKVNSSLQASRTRPRPANRRRQQNSATSDEDEAAYSSEEEESDFVVESDNEEPERFRNNRKRKDRDEDSEDEGAPDFAIGNAISKGLRTTKRARTTAVY